MRELASGWSSEGCIWNTKRCGFISLEIFWGRISTLRDQVFQCWLGLELCKYISTGLVFLSRQCEASVGNSKQCLLGDFVCAMKWHIRKIGVSHYLHSAIFLQQFCFDMSFNNQDPATELIPNLLQLNPIFIIAAGIRKAGCTDWVLF